MNESAHSVIGDISASGWDLLWVVLLALVLWAALRGARFAIDVAPFAGARRESLRRAFPAPRGSGSSICSSRPACSSSATPPTSRSRSP